VLIHYRKPGVNREEFLNQTLAITRKELKSTDLNLKLQAAYKLLFLFNEGIDIQWAAFNVIEMMASNRLQAKRISYTLAGLIF
jgi:AP-3 complex subunit delta-1